MDSQAPQVEQNQEIIEHVSVPTALEIQMDSQKAISRLHSINQVIDGAVKVSLQRTNPKDWVRMGERLYLQGSGALKLRAIFGIYFRNREVTKEVYQDGSYGFLVTGIVGSKLLDSLYGEVTLDIEGGRSSKDPFFTKGNREPDPLDVRKAALTNFEVRAITALLGLGNMTEQDLTKNGIDVSRIGRVDYQKGAEGGGNTTVISEAQRKRLYAISKSARVVEETVKELLARYGWTSSTQITREKYEEICLVVQGGPAAVAKQILKLAGLTTATEREPGEDNG